MRDFLPEPTMKLKVIEKKARRIAQLYGYSEVITPILESYELLTSKIGEEIRSRMYAFKDLGGRNVALRPEFTASIARLASTTLRTWPKPLRIFCAGRLYRYDEPQHGRFREFWQANYELLGSSRPEADAEIMLLANDFLKKLGLKNFSFKIGHVNVLKEILKQEEVEEPTINKIMHLMDKRQYNKTLNLLRKNETTNLCSRTIEELVKIQGRTSSEIMEKMEQSVEKYKKAVNAIDNLKQILELVMNVDENINIKVEPGFARGLEYYTGMIFEIFVPEMNIALGGGGRYDKLIELFGGEPTPAVGVAPGLDRIFLATEKQKIIVAKRKQKKLIVIPVQNELIIEAIKVAHTIREAEIPSQVEVMGRNMTKALEDADRRQKDYAIILGDKELREGKMVIRDLKKRTQQTIKMEKLAEFLGKTLS
jgi:histidyl-tRNA synthetase